MNDFQVLEWQFGNVNCVDEKVSSDHFDVLEEIGGV
jgi:hypothetical protein